MNDENNIAPSPVAEDWAEALPKYSESKRVISVFFGRPLPVVGLVIIAILLLAAIFSPLIAPDDPSPLRQETGRCCFHHSQY